MEHTASREEKNVKQHMLKALCKPWVAFIDVTECVYLLKLMPL